MRELIAVFKGHSRASIKNVYVRAYNVVTEVRERETVQQPATTPAEHNGRVRPPPEKNAAAYVKRYLRVI